ncbi:MAG: hypothetical protein GX567_17630, partial [Clostridia bacterium]|nr:hypothetical protein [Clostridia bacterium]
ESIQQEYQQEEYAQEEYPQDESMQQEYQQEEYAQEEYPQDEGIQQDSSQPQSAPIQSKTKTNLPSYMVMEEGIKSKRDFDEDERRIFAAYEGIEIIKAQLVDSMDVLSMDAASGNVVIMGAVEWGRKDLAIDMVKAMQIYDDRFTGKVAKITGKALNKKNVASTLEKLAGGALIVEEAGGLSRDNMRVICETLQSNIDMILVVFEDTKEALQLLLDTTKNMKQIFNAIVDIPEFGNDDLVAYGKGIAREQEYSIDEMGVLALYTRIGELQTADHVVSLEDVKEIINEAIKHVDKKNMSHFVDVLFAKRYDDDDCIILREKDFIIK